MKRILFTMLAAVLALGLAVPVVQANSWDGSINWTGQGSGSLRCDKLGEGPRTTDGWIHWVVTSATDVTAAELVLGGSGSGEYGIYERHGGTIHFFTPYFDVATLTATVYYNGSLGNNSQFVISDYCPAGGEAEEREVLTVTKSAVTSYTRTHYWSIDKYVDTENGYEHEGYPKIWLFVNGSGDETATWTVDVTYEGYEDSDFNVSGTITIENTGNAAANITSVQDLLAGTPIDVDWGGVEFPYTLEVGQNLTGTYSVDVESKIEDYNVVTVTTERFDYVGYAEVVWGDPTTEVNKTVTVVDTSDLLGEVTLGTVTAPDNAQFTYTEDFAWEDYGAEGCGEYTYDNTAEVIGDNEVVLDSADATLKVNVQCYIYETAYAKGSSAICFIPTFANWGWTNPITPGTYEMDLWAAAGQCDTSKGIKVGTVTVVYNGGGYVTVNYNVAFPYSLEETHVYAGTTKFPQVKQGKKTVSTVAPGQYYNASPFGGGTVYVIAHAIVGIPDPNFGP
jgi:hypothetical protein